MRDNKRILNGDKIPDDIKELWFGGEDGNHTVVTL